MPDLDPHGRRASPTKSPVVLSLRNIGMGGGEPGHVSITKLEEKLLKTKLVTLHYNETCKCPPLQVDHFTYGATICMHVDLELRNRSISRHQMLLP